MTFYSIMESISHLGKMARTSAKSENPIGFNISNTNTQRCPRGSRGVNHLFSAYGQYKPCWTFLFHYFDVSEKYFAIRFIVYFFFYI